MIKITYIFDMPSGGFSDYHRVYDNLYSLLQKEHEYLKVGTITKTYEIMIHRGKNAPCYKPGDPVIKS